MTAAARTARVMWFALGVPSFFSAVYSLLFTTETALKVEHYTRVYFCGTLSLSTRAFRKRLPNLPPPPLKDRALKNDDTHPCADSALFTLYGNEDRPRRDRQRRTSRNSSGA